MKRVLLVCYSQSGQLSRCAETFIEPMRRAGAEVDVISPQPTTAFPWPWPFTKFVDVFAESVKGKAPQMNPATLKAPHENYDLVVIAYQVWYLAPALPVVGWLESEQANLLKDTPVIALCACRNMWQRAFVDLKKLIAAKGGKLIDHVVREDAAPAAVTFWTTPRWVIFGDKVGATKLFPPAGVSDADIASLSSPGGKVAEALMSGKLLGSVLNGSEARVNRLFVIPELIARFFFGLWAALISGSGPFGRWLYARLFFVSLCSSLPLMIPVAVGSLFIRLFARGWFKAKVEEVTA